MMWGRNEARSAKGASWRWNWHAWTIIWSPSISASPTPPHLTSLPFPSLPLGCVIWWSGLQAGNVGLPAKNTDHIYKSRAASETSPPGLRVRAWPVVVRVQSACLSSILCLGMPQPDPLSRPCCYGLKEPDSLPLDRVTFRQTPFLYMEQNKHTQNIQSLCFLLWIHAVICSM